MNRRKFLSLGPGAAAGLPGTGQPAPASPRGGAPPAVLVFYTTENHRRRLQNISVFEHGVRKCRRKHLITSYIQGQCLYNVTSKDREPREQDEQELARFRDHGIGIVQTWDWFADPWSGQYLRPRNPRGARRFIDLVHKYGMKLLPYTSTNFFERKDPAFRAEWAWPAAWDLVEEGWNLAHCSPSSPSWRAFVLPPLIRLLEDYGVDGLYNDLGYARSGEQPSYYTRRSSWAEDEVFAFHEGPKHDGAMADMLALIYEEVKRRGLIYKLHKEATDTV